MNGKTAKLIRKFAKEMGIDPKSNRNKYRAMKRKHARAGAPEQARGTKMMRETLASS